MSKEPTIKSDLGRVDEMTDEVIDYSDIPPSTDEQLEAMKPLSEALPRVFAKIQSTIRLDDDVFRWFRKRAQTAGNEDYGVLVNSALRQYMRQHS